MSADLHTFGSELKALREARGISQKLLISRIPLHYGAERAYRRVERGERRPDRVVVIDILTKGLLETDVLLIERFLGWAGYAGLTAVEQKELGLKRAEIPVEHLPVEPIPVPVPDAAALPIPTREPSILFYTSIVSGSVMLVTVLASTATDLSMWFTVLTTTMYAALYSVSILLETAYQSDTPHSLPPVIYTSCFMLISSALGLCLDAWIVQNGSGAGFAFGLALFLFTATIQFVGMRRRLPSSAIVEVSFESHTAQSAHLKNTLYFLSVVLFFWLPPVHTILTIDRELRIGNRRFVASLFSGSAPAYGLWYPPASWLWMLLILVFGATLLMRGQLLDNLKPHPRRNRYLILFYTRALLYFSLSFVCLAWYSYSLAWIARTITAGE